MAETWRLVKQKAQLAQDHGTIVKIRPDCVRVGNAGWSAVRPESFRISAQPWRAAWVRASSPLAWRVQRGATASRLAAQDWRRLRI